MSICRYHYRRPRTAQEHRANYAHPELTRAKRTGHNLPTAWDDNRRSNGQIRTWKNNKVRKQWM